MTPIAPTVQAFFTDRLGRQRRASVHTIAAYRDTVRLLLTFATTRTGTEPSRLDFAQLDAPLVGAFLDHLEHERGNAIRTRNARLAAIHSLFRHAALRHPEHAADIQRVLAIPPKRFERTIITFLTEPEIDALLAGPDPATRTGRRDRAMLQLAVETGLRVSELTGLTRGDLHLGAGAHVGCHGKGRKDRITPLTAATTALLTAYLAERQDSGEAPLFATTRGRPLTRDAFERRLALHATRAAESCPSIAGKKISPHVLRHTAAMRLLHAGVETTVIALWLGHESPETTQIYLHADLALKKQALDRTRPHNTAPGSYQPTDRLLTFLEGL
jgi:integrase/recombinase XerD